MADSQDGIELTPVHSLLRSSSASSHRAKAASSAQEESQVSALKRLQRLLHLQGRQRQARSVSEESQKRRFVPSWPSKWNFSWLTARIPSWMSIWSLEILAAVLSLLCVLGNAILLYELDGRPYQLLGLLGLHVTPNTMISILSTIARASLLYPVGQGISQLKWTYFEQRPHRVYDLQVFDDASRGAVGAVQMLWIMRLRAVMASLGAIITVLALAVEPFTQQILSFPILLDAANNETAVIGTTRVLDSSGYRPENSKGGNDLSNVYFDYSLLQGVLNPGLQTNYTCSSGDCEWPVFDSLGMCSQCMAYSDWGPISISCSPVYDKTWPIFAGETSFNCMYTFDDTWTVNNTWFITPPHASNTSVLQPQTLISTQVQIPDYSPGGNLSATSFSALFANLTIVTFGNAWFPGVNDPSSMLNSSANSDVQASMIAALENGDISQSTLLSISVCNFTWCAQTFQHSQCRSGVLYDDPYSATDIAFDPVCADDDICFGIPTGSPRILAGSLTNHTNSSSNGGFPPMPNNNSVQYTGGPYYLRYSDVVTFQQAFAGYLQVCCEATTDNINNNTGFGLVLCGDVVYAGDQDPHTYATVAGVAQAVTNQLRQSLNSTSVTGTVFLPVTRIKVRWPWLIYPASLSILATVFLIVSICFSMERNKLVWKSSSMALLYHGFHEQDPNDFNLMTLKEMDEAAKELRVRLRWEPDGSVTFVRSLAHD